MYVYTLTHLTGRERNAQRTATLFSFEIRRRTLVLVVVSLLISAVPATVMGILLGPYFFLGTPFVVTLVVFVLYEQRSRKGLKLRLYQSLLDRRRSNTSELHMCWRPVTPARLAPIVASSVPAAHTLTGPEQVWTKTRGRRARKA